MLVPASLVKSLLFCPMKVYLEFGLGVRPPDLEGETGRQAHMAYEMLTVALYEKGRITESDVEEACGAAPLLGRREVELLARFRESVGLAGVPVRVEVEVASETLGLVGRVDILEGEHPVEVKYRGYVTKADVVQLALYAVMLREQGVNCTVGFIDLLRSRRRIRVNVERLASLASRVASELRRAAVEPRMPERPPCERCDLREACAMFTLGALE